MNRPLPSRQLSPSPRLRPKPEIAKKSRRPHPLPRGKTVISSKLDADTYLLSKPASSSGGVGIEPGTALKIKAYKDGWHKVETMSFPKRRGWISDRVGPPLHPQLTIPRCDRTYIAFAPVKGKAFNGPVKIRDINQGWLGDCYLIGSLGALAVGYPHVIQKAIRPGPQPGAYIVTLGKISDNGRNWGKREIKVDNIFPTKDGHLLYAQGGKVAKPRFELDKFENGKRPLWPAIIEKAFATLVGGYDKLDKGGIEELAFESLTGNPATVYQLARPGSADNLKPIEQLKRAVRQGLPITCCTKSRKIITEPPVFKDHVYIAVGHSKDKIILRNPHDTRQTMALSYKDFERVIERITVANP